MTGWATFYRPLGCLLKQILPIGSGIYNVERLLKAAERKNRRGCHPRKLPP